MTRRASAPRLIEWTGERCVPWAPDVQVIYEHYHRYLWVRSLVEGKAVLDLGSGEGFGSALLGEIATRVHGIDLDATAVEHARLRYGAPSVSFSVGDATAIPDHFDGTFDVVVAFEVLEHVENHEALIAGVKRVLKPGGVLVISTPNRLLYETVEGGNPFHLKELSDTEFDGLLAGQFANHVSLAQRVGEGSRIARLEPGGPELPPFNLERAGDEWQEVGPLAPYYLLAVASDGDLPDGIGSSTLLDHSLGLLRSAERTAAERVAASVNELSEALALRAEAESRLQATGAELALAATQRDEAVGHAQREAVALLEARDQVRAAESEIASLHAEIARRTAEVNESISWRLFLKVRHRWRGGGDRPRAIARIGGRLLRGASAVNRQRVRRQSERVVTVEEVSDSPTVLLSIPSSETPQVSIVIPVYSGAELTEACLRAIVTSSLNGPTYEVVVVDDQADEATKQLLDRVEGIRVIANEENLGFLRSVNRGVEHVRGQIVVLLNNDTEPQPGWLAPLVRRLSSNDRVGAVGGRLVYPHGALQEAGGVVFADGSAVNYGNGADPAAAAYRFARPVDYCSAALLALPTAVWREVGGFDEQFVPGYYEDTDLCFRLRAAGYEVWFDPASIVIHKEGGSHGTDVTQGVKRHQVINQKHFIERWGADLADRPATASVAAARVHADRRNGPVVLIADHIVPEPDRDAGSLRMMHLIRALLERGARVVFLPENRHATPGYAEQLESLGVEVLDSDVQLHSRLLELRSACRLVILSRPHIAAVLLPDVRSALPGARVVYDTVDLHWIRETGRQLFEAGPQATIEAYREIELALVRATDITAVVTHEERDEIIAAVPGADVRYLPVVHDLPPAGPGRAGRRGALFVGGFRHRPNVDAARQLGEHIMPLLRSSGVDIGLTIVGPDVPPEVASLASLDIEVAGWVERLEPLLDGSTMMVAPLRYGAGMKGKVGQALAHGLPVITTAVGAQGFGLVHEQDVLLAETPEEFADAIARLEDDEELWTRLSTNGRQVIARTCSVQIMADAVDGLLDHETAAQRKREPQHMAR